MGITKTPAQTNKTTISQWVTRSLALLGVLMLFILSLSLMRDAFSALGREFTRELIQATANPIIGLLIGILATAILQSSSAITSVCVTMVAVGTLTLEGAIPIVLGANVGTTVTSTMMSLTFVGNKKLFKRAIGGAALHDFFNLFSVLVLLPVELYTNMLARFSRWLSSLITYPGWAQPHHMPTDKVADTLYGMLPSWMGFVLSIAMLLVSIKWLSSLSRRMLLSKNEEGQTFFERTFFESDASSLFSGLSLTAIVQSSSLTSSLIVPLVAVGKLGMSRAFAFLIGANVGTTFTALFVAYNSHVVSGMQIALVHVIVNIGGALFFMLPATPKMAYWYAKKLGKLGARNKMFGFAYLLLIFFLLPFLLIWLSKMLGWA